MAEAFIRIDETGRRRRRRRRRVELVFCGGGATPSSNRMSLSRQKPLRPAKETHPFFEGTGPVTSAAPKPGCHPEDPFSMVDDDDDELARVYTVYTLARVESYQLLMMMLLLLLYCGMWTPARPKSKVQTNPNKKRNKIKTGRN